MNGYEVFEISRIIKAKLITLTETLIILDITKSEYLIIGLFYVERKKSCFYFPKLPSIVLISQIYSESFLKIEFITAVIKLNFWKNVSLVLC